MPRMAVFILMITAGTICPAADQPLPKSTKNTELRDELLRRIKKDQETRMTIVKWMKDNGLQGSIAPDSLGKEKKAEFDRLVEKVTETDKANTKWLKEVVDKHGWPTISLVGKDGSDAAWLLVQHADDDLKFQRHCLDLMAKLPKSEVSQANFAYLTDRVLVTEGKKQLYGTQFTIVDGKLKPLPIEDEANVDKRRAELGLGTLAAYTKVIAQQYGASKKK